MTFDGGVYWTPLDFAFARGCPEIIAMISNALGPVASVVG
jgi:hypothetical protein